MTVFKFILPIYPRTAITRHADGSPALEMYGCLAIVAADTEEQARAVLTADPDVDQRWIPHARVSRIEVTGPTLLGLSQ